MYSTGCLKKLSFAKLSIWRSCCQLGRNAYDIIGKTANAQFSQTQFFCDTLYIGGASHEEIARKTFRQNTSRGGGTTCLLAWELPVAIGLLFVILSCVTHLHHIYQRNGMEYVRKPVTI